MQTIIDIINAIPDGVRTVDVVYATLRVIAAVLGVPFWEDGSIG